MLVIQRHSPFFENCSIEAIIFVIILSFISSINLVSTLIGLAKGVFFCVKQVALRINLVLLLFMYFTFQFMQDLFGAHIYISAWCYSNFILYNSISKLLRHQMYTGYFVICCVICNTLILNNIESTIVTIAEEN